MNLMFKKNMLINLKREMLSYIVQTFQLEIINQKCFIRGHNFSSCDQGIEVTERATEAHKEIYHPEDWLSIIKMQNKNGQNICCAEDEQ